VSDEWPIGAVPGTCRRHTPATLPIASISSGRPNCPAVAWCLAVAGLVVAGCRNATIASTSLSPSRRNGHQALAVTYPAEASSITGIRPRDTVIAGDRVYLFGPWQSACVTGDKGALLWKNAREGLQTPRLEWGLTVTPLVVDSLVITQPAAETVASSPRCGDGMKSGRRREYRDMRRHSAKSVSRGGVGYDAKSLGGWDVKPAPALELTPPVPGDFQVPTRFSSSQKGAAATFRDDRKQRSAAVYLPARWHLDPEPVGVSSGSPPTRTHP